MKISNFLLHGQDNAVPLRYLIQITGIDGRTIRQMIAIERKAGIPILSDNMNGYYLPASSVEVTNFVRSMRSRAHEIITAAEAVEKARGQFGE